MNFPIKTISELQSISSAMKWQYFEKLVAFIFEQNNFDAKQNVIVKDGYGIKRQFDVIAKRYDTTYLIECKKWKNRKQKESALRSAVAKHLERCALYAALLGKALAEKHDPGVPLIVTLLEENITEHDGVVIVPIMKLNWFINNFDSI